MWSTIKRAVGLHLALIFIGAECSLNNGLMSISITRHHKGDLFLAQGGTCYEDLCVGMSSGTASSTDSTGCNCQCMPNLPVFRDDLHICVDDIQECTLAPFVSGTTTQKVPYVFLPLKGQIVYPSAEIIVSDGSNPICVVSGAKFLGRRGWIQIRNNTELELPFRLFRDEGRTYLQWLGEGDLRLAMEGRLLLVHLMCKDASGEKERNIFTPCIAFRVAGNPSSGVREMMFVTDKNGSRDGEKSLSVSEYIAIGVCILLLGLIYVASLFLYFYYRRKKKDKKKPGERDCLTVAEEGIVKSNPLLQATRRHLAAVAGQDNGGYASDSGSCSSESDRCSDIMLPEDDCSSGHHQNLEISAMVHPCNLECNAAETMLNQESNNIEKLPEEDVSIVETLEGKEERPETVRTMGTGNVRKKLYFNPAYFELDLLKAPPPAALEFLTKIREVIAVAKHKMSAKRFSPSLNGIPEEEYYSRGGKVSSTGNRSRPASVISYAESTDSKRNKTPSCRVCTETELAETVPSFDLDEPGSCCPTDAKQKIIQKWLEDVPFVKSQKEHEQNSKTSKPTDATIKSKICMEKVPLKEESKIKAEEKSEVDNETPKTLKEGKSPPAPPQRKENRKYSKGPAPPRPPPPPPLVPPQPRSVTNNPQILEKIENTKLFGGLGSQNEMNSSKSNNDTNKVTTPPPAPVHNHVSSKSNGEIVNIPQEDVDSVPRVQGKDKVPPVVAKTLMDAVIKELIVQRKNDKPIPNSSGVQNFIKKTLKSNFDIVQAKNARNEKFHNSDKNIFEVDSLERKMENVNLNDSIEENPGTKEVNLDENIVSNNQLKEIDSCIEIYGENIISKNKNTIDSIIETNDNPGVQDEHDYEVILLNATDQTADDQEEKEKELKIYNLPEILSKNDRSEGYSLVSEVYVNDGYSYSSDGSTQSNGSDENKQGKNRSFPSEKPGRLTIHVKDSPDNYKRVPDETDTFEPDTLDRKPGKFRYSKTIGVWEDNMKDQYSNQRFHEMDLECQHSNSGHVDNNENYIDSLERPRISLKTTGSFRRNSLERDVNELFKNLNAPPLRHFGSLREIYEAKSKTHRRTETTSLIGSIPSDIECRSTLSWSEDRKNKLLHRGIILHVNEDNKKHRRHKTKSHISGMNYPDVVPPRPPKPRSLSATPNQGSIASTPANRSYCPTPTSRSLCTSPPPRSNCTSPRPTTIQFPPPPPPPRTMNQNDLKSPNHSGRTSPHYSHSQSICSSPICSGRSSPAKMFSALPQLPPRSPCSSPTPQKGRQSPSIHASYIPPPPRITSIMKQSFTSTCRSPSPSARSSPIPPPRPLSTNNSPPLPPRSAKPPLPPKNARSTRQKKPGTNISQRRHETSLARRPLPPIPSPRHYQDSTLSSLSSRDLETLSMLSGASLDSLNSSDYEAFYTLPYDGNEGDLYGKALGRLSDSHKSIHNDNSFDPNRPIVFFSEGYNQKLVANEPENDNISFTKTKRTSNSMKSWRKSSRRGHKLEDSGYLSTDSESGKRHIPTITTVVSERSENNGSQGSETEESLCDGASESGAESIATDSFFFGNFNKVKTAGSLDSGVGSEVNKSFLESFRIIDNNVNSESKGRDILITVRQ